MAVEISKQIKIPPGMTAIVHTDGRKIPRQATPAENEIQTITQDSGTATGGTFALTFGTQKTAAIVFDATAAVVEAALRLLTNIGTSGVDCTGGALPGTPIVCTFNGILSGTDVALMVVDGALLTGTSPIYLNSLTTAGTAGGGEKIGDIIQRDTDGTTNQGIGLITDVGAEYLPTAKGKKLLPTPVLAGHREDIQMQIEGIIAAPSTATLADAALLTWDGSAFVANATGAHRSVGPYDGTQAAILVDINITGLPKT